MANTNLTESVATYILLPSVVFKFTAMIIGVVGNTTVIIYNIFLSKEKTMTSYLTSSGGACKLGEDKNLIIRWYTNTESLTLRGERANGVKDRIISFAQSENNLEKFESNRPFQDQEVLHNILCITPTGIVMKKKPHSILDENTLEDLRFEMMAFITTTNDKFEVLTKDIKILKQDKHMITLTILGYWQKSKNYKQKTMSNAQLCA
ncbi:Hypothetical predicted protein [Paramuricea clavata]|uniref:Uncharacterized protein n=1 Tax=Paramuricea clavata TaxID=317549 RepID=A0A6S7HSV6_PARCT|nr:Hypothetical predicted protein [Paramuricea clavata]